MFVQPYLCMQIMIRKQRNSAHRSKARNLKVPFPPSSRARQFPQFLPQEGRKEGRKENSPGNQFPKRRQGVTVCLHVWFSRCLCRHVGGRLTKGLSLALFIRPPARCTLRYCYLCLLRDWLQISYTFILLLFQGPQQCAIRKVMPQRASAPDAFRVVVQLYCSDLQ